MKTTYHIPFDYSYQGDPHRGDLLQSNIGDKKRERTWLILAVKRLTDRTCKEMGGVLTRRYKIWAERWYDLEPETRMALYRSAERHGGQLVHSFKRFPAKKKVKTFEQYLGAK
jgi:hypothetical protein